MYIEHRYQELTGGGGDQNTPNCVVKNLSLPALKIMWPILLNPILYVYVGWGLGVDGWGGAGGCCGGGGGGTIKHPL